MVWVPLDVPAGIVTVMAEVPLAGTGLGVSVPARMVPVVWLSRRHVTVSPGM